MRRVFVGALLLLTTACGAYHFPGGEPAPGTVGGKVSVTGCGPVQPAGGICAMNRPLAGAEIDFTGGGNTLAAVTAADGAYAIQLPAGTYKVSFKPPLMIVSGPKTLTITAGVNTVANYVVDSGIRAPLPQQ